MDNFLLYLKGVRAEWGKITWPERKQVVAQTIVVLAIVTFFTIFTYCLDILFEWVLTAAHIAK